MDAKTAQMALTFLERAQVGWNEIPAAVEVRNALTLLARPKEKPPAQPAAPKPKKTPAKRRA